MSLLCLEAERCGGSGFQTPQANRLAGIVAIAIRAIINPADGGINFRDQFALAIAGAELNTPVCFTGFTIVLIGLSYRAILQ